MDASWQATTTRALPAALEPRGEQQMPLQLFFASFAAAHRVRSAGSTLIRELKEHRTFDCEELFPSDLRLGTHTDGARP